ncbi:MAG: ComF family protein [Zoogloeaceae bacterium]|jgi:ComF family protein|nr:ComF family protein [Zoogloeaceae bacterium]
MRPGKSILARIAARVTCALLPPVCLLCGASGGHLPVCPGCRADLPRLPASACPFCLEPTPHGACCGACLRHPPHFDRLTTLYPYAFPVDRLVLAFKYQAQFALARWWAEELGARLDAAAAEADMVAPVPLHPARLAERGYNQAHVLARHLARELGLPLDAACLVKHRATPPQSASNRKTRRQNLKNAFTVVGDVDGRRVLLVDDVFTTGATLDEAARCLKQRGAATVLAVTVARTLKTGI